MTISITYDEHADAMYVRVREGHSVRQAVLDDARIVDYSAHGEVLGVEFLNVSAGVRLADVPLARRLSNLIEQSGLGVVVSV